MSAYIYPVKMGLIIFPLLAVLITGPFAVLQYKKYGAVNWIRVLVIYSFVYYMLTAYFMVILPLPDPSSVAASDWKSHLRLMPFNNLEVYFRHHGVPHSLKSILELIKSETAFQLFFNIVLTIPFGVYMRYYFKRSWLQTLMLSFLLSLFYESTQLSALYGIYPAPYRTADADDLICNSLGGLFGYALTPAFVFFLPDRERIDQSSYQKSTTVTRFRRMWADFTDLLVFLIIYSVLNVFAAFIIHSGSKDAVPLALTFHFRYFILYLWLTSIIGRGISPGKSMCRITLAGTDSKPLRPAAITLRYLILALETSGTAALGSWLYRLYESNTAYFRNIYLLLSIAVLVFQICFALKILLKIFGFGKTLWYEKYSHTHLISIFHIPDHEQ